MSREGAGATAAEIAAALRAAIDAGEYQPGDKLPGENSLMEQYGVARMTARRALGMLREQGLTTTRRGVGVFVRGFHPIVRNSIKRASQRQWGAGRALWDADDNAANFVVDRVDVRAEVTPPTDAAAILKLGDGEMAAIRGRRFNLHDKPVMLSTSYLPAALVAGTAITESSTGPGGTYARLADLGHAPAHFREDVISRMPTPAEAEALQMQPGTPVMVITRTAVTAEGRPVEVNFMTLDAASFVVRYDFDA